MKPRAETVESPGGLQGRLFLPGGTGRAGAVVLLHERYGLVQHTLDLAARAADDGYVALAPDLFAGWRGDRDALGRGELRVVLPDDEVAAVIGSGLDQLGRHPRVDPNRMAVVGVCQSGRYPIVAACKRADIAACVVIYGAASKRDWEVSDEQPRALEEMLRELPPTLFLFGEADHVISLDDVARLRGALESARRSYRMRVFAGMPHGWLNDTMPGRYRPREAEEAWSMVRSFLGDVFSGRWPPPGRVCWEFTGDISPGYDFTRNRRLE